MLRSQYVLESGVQGHTSVGIITIKHLNSITAGLVLAFADRVTPDCLISHVTQQGVAELNGSTCSGSEGLEDWEDGAVIEEVTN